MLTKVKSMTGQSSGLQTVALCLSLSGPWGTNPATDMRHYSAIPDPYPLSSPCPVWSLGPVTRMDGQKGFLFIHPYVTIVDEDEIRDHDQELLMCVACYPPPPLPAGVQVSDECGP